MELPELVTDPRTLADYCEKWRALGCFCFDTEFIRDDTYDAALCLIQVAADDEVVLIDPTADLDVSQFWEMVCDPAVQTVVHAGKEDFEVCLRATGKVPRNVFDIQVAAGLVGLGYPLSLARLVHAVLRKRIGKGQTLTDWLRRPLTDNQLRYAVEDVKYLPAIHRELVERLARRKRESWATEEFQSFEHPAHYRRPPEQRLFKFKGSKKLDSHGLAVLERLIEWRDNWAQQRNRPTRALVRDDILVTIAQRRPKRASELQILRGFPQSRKSHVVQEVLDLIKEVDDTPRSEWPEPYKARDDNPMAKAAMNILAGFTRAICYDEDVGHDLVASTQRLHELLDHLVEPQDDPPLLLTGWRRDFIGQRLVDLLEGRSELRLDGWPDQLRLRIKSRTTRTPKKATTRSKQSDASK